MFELNPFHLEDASLLHFIMLQGTVILGYLIGRLLLQRRKERLEARLRLLREQIDELMIVEPEVVEELEASPGRDDLKEIAGINRKAEEVLNRAGIFRFAQLARTPVATIQRILENYGPLLYTYDPVTWPAQARLAADGRWRELRRWQDQMRRGESKDYSHLLPAP